MPPPPTVQLRGVTATFGGRPLFEGLDLELRPGERACLVGRNGSGKSTLLRLIAGALEPDRGMRFVQPGTRIGWLAQERQPAAGRLLDFIAGGGAEAPEAHQAARLTDALGLDGQADAAGLSGGQARRAELARALAVAPDLLLLDEPTNHLDLPAIEWLEGEIAAFAGALLMISHDRAFLERLATSVLWLDRGRLRVRAGGFAGFEDWRQATFAAEEAEAQKLGRRIDAETRWLHEGLTARRRRNMGRVRALEALRRERRERAPRVGTAALQAAGAAPSGRLVVEASGIAKRYGGRTVVAGFSTRILRGDRVGIVGRNGAGKTTLARMLVGALAPDEGRIRFGAALALAHFDQAREALDPAASLRQVLAPGGGDQVMVGGRPRHVASYLKDFLFDASRLESPVASLSGGERSRLLLARLFAAPSNLLLLDEPTNDLDMETLDLLEDVLAQYAGTLILVSHDRDLLDRLATSIIAVGEGGRVTETVGGWSDHVRQRPAAGPPPPARPRPPPPDRGRGREPRGLTYRDRRELDRLPAHIDSLQAEAQAIEARLADAGAWGRDPDGFAAAAGRLTAVRAEIAQAEDRWLALAAEAEHGDG